MPSTFYLSTIVVSLKQQPLFTLCWSFFFLFFFFSKQILADVPLSLFTRKEGWLVVESEMLF